MGPVDSNVENDGRDIQRVPAEKLEKGGVAEDRRDVGHNGGGGSDISVKNKVGGSLNWNQTGDGGSGSGAATDI